MRRAHLGTLQARTSGNSTSFEKIRKRMDDTAPEWQSGRHSTGMISEYLKENVQEFRELSVLRQKGWENPAGDAFFQKQKRNADNSNSSAKDAQFFYKLMKKIGHEINHATKAFIIAGTGSHITDKGSILDLCMAPGGFLSTALELNPASRALAFSLPVDNGGHNILLPPNARVETKLLDLTMLAADMGVTAIPPEHADAANFLPRQIPPSARFNLVFCDGQVLRTHARASYREHREARRLTSTQLALGLAHLAPGGTMVVLLHRVEAWDTVLCLRRFSRFATVRLFKPAAGHAKRSSFYLVASAVRSGHAEALRAVEAWRAGWRAATFAPSDEAFGEALRMGEPSVEEVLRDFGPLLVSLGREVWEVQARALAKAPFIAGR